MKNHQPESICDCGKIGTQVIGAPISLKVAPDIAYDSPIDGTPITSWHARQEDLKKHNCQPYDEGQKQDYLRRMEEHDKALDKAVDEHVEAAFAKMSYKQRQKLNAEVMEMGMTAEYARGTKTA